jgi:hypothetical protein
VGLAEVLRFDRGELASLLEATAGSPTGGPSGLDWAKDKVKNLKDKLPKSSTLALRSLIKGLNPLQLKHPLDRTPFLLGQAGYSKEKGIRTVQQLMTRPGVVDILSTMGGAPNPAHISNLLSVAQSGIAGALLGSKSKIAKTIGSGINLAGNVAQDFLGDMNNPATQAQRAILAGSILGDPRIAQIKASDIVRVK